MKYGKRERVTGIVILAALAVIFLPMLFSEPAPRGEGPEPVLTVEQPIDLPRNSVSSPSSPLPNDAEITHNERRSSQVTQTSQLIPSQRDDEPSRPAQRSAPPAQGTSTGSASSRSNEASKTPSKASSAAPQDPIMAAALRGSNSLPATAKNGDWAVQAGSFGEPGNADRLIAQLKEQGFSAYKKPRGNLNTVFVGPFSSSEQGEKARVQLQQKANIKGLVVRRKDNE
ncbi:SPOR domain-containing protein [Phytohalomonas tamaricis]|uniref:SPOR domain-containing protein n=1 Tax=Phytohalomonas tamaricis TaxID=2081032 RepID=UPI001319D6D8|nr:SPOR domain-containing protein [Phytohalomonas tamaricis]